MISEQLQKEGVRFVLLKKQEKIPFEKNWTLSNYGFNDPELTDWINKGNNYGVIGGEKNLIILDFDDKDVQDEIVPLLPKTFTVETGSGGLHKYFFCNDAKSFKILDKDKNTLIDIQGQGKQVVGPNSIHPNGKPYRVVEDVPIGFIRLEHLQIILSKYTRPKDSYKPTYTVDEITEEVRDKVKLTDLMKDEKYDLSKNPTMCMLGHESGGGKCFSYNETTGLWYCFHCDEGGDIFNFIMNHKDKSFPMAKKYLMDYCGVKDKDTRTNLTGILRIASYVDNVKHFWEMQPFFFDKGETFWMWSKIEHKWEPVDNIDIMNAIDNGLQFGGETVTSGIRGNYLEAFKRIGRERIPKDAPSSWIQFKDTILDTKTGNTFKVTPEYFVCNPIPWELGDSEHTPIIDTLFEEWVGEKYVMTLFEIIAYCCITDYPIHLLFSFIGTGCNGKSKFQQLLTKFIGKDNCCSTELDVLVNSRFESSKMYKKLVCTMGETNFGTLNKTSILKKLTGQDSIGFEQKNKPPFSDLNYAKIIINSNSLPSSDDTSEGFFRRWFIIDFPNKFQEGKDILKSIPEEEYSNLAKKVSFLIPKILERGHFSNQGSMEDRRLKYILSSNPLPFFIEQECKEIPDGYIRYSLLYTYYVNYLKEIKKRIIGKREFTNALEREGYEIRKTNKKIGESFINDRWVEGISFKSKEKHNY